MSFRIIWLVVVIQVVSVALVQLRFVLRITFDDICRSNFYNSSSRTTRPGACYFLFDRISRSFELAIPEVYYVLQCVRSVRDYHMFR